MTDEDADRIDYRTIPVSDDKPPEDYTFAERRAEILRRIEDAGSPDRLNGVELSNRYGCTPENIYNDFDVLGNYVSATVGDRVDMKINAVFNKAIRGLLQQKEYRKAAKTAAEYGEWVRDRHELEDLWDELEEIQDGMNDL
jgi:hypothetical protein